MFLRQSTAASLQAQIPETTELQTGAWCCSWDLPQRRDSVKTASLEVKYTSSRSWSMLCPVAQVAMQMTRLQACISDCKEQQQYSFAELWYCSRLCTHLQRRVRRHMSLSPVRAASVHFFCKQNPLWQNPDFVVQFCFPGQGSQEILQCCSQ